MASATEHAKDGYHHGELPDTLMKLALEHIAESGTEKLSLRALAREAGVSATAPYRHFPTKQCLLAALATRGFNELRARTQEAVNVDAPVEERFVRMGVAYIEFARNNPISYQIMFGSVLADFSAYDMLHTAANESYAVVLEQLQELIDRRKLDIDVSELGAIVWSGVHGMASLLLTKMESTADSRPMESVKTIAQDPERALRYMFSHLIG
jgi:AcrR family transcriptional regulator